MGGCIAKLAKITIMPPAPRTFTELTSAEVKQIIIDTMKIDPKQIKLADAKYNAYDVECLRKFLEYDVENNNVYTEESFDCDDFSTGLMAQERAWYARAGTKRASTFGMVWGDIRSKDTDTEPSPHSLNFLIDNNKTIWLIEPQTDRIFRPTANSTFWNCVI